MKKIAGLFLLTFAVSSGVTAAEVFGITHDGQHTSLQSQENRRRGRGRGSDDSNSNRNSNSNDSNTQNSDSGNSAAAARRAALNAVPGRIMKEEYEYKDGRAIYEFYIRDSEDRVFEVYVDAENAKVTKIERRSKE